MPARFRMTTVFEGLATGDKRFINAGALTTRALPLTLMAMLENPEMGGHAGAQVAGRIDTLTRVDAAALVDEASGDAYGAGVWAWVGEGEFADSDLGEQVTGLVRDQVLRGVSVDLAAMTTEFEVLEEDEEGWPVDWIDKVTAAEIAAATVCNIPAFRGCTIELVDDTADAAQADQGLVASGAPWLPAWTEHTDQRPITAAGGPLAPPAAWFHDPQLQEPTPLTVLDDGRVFGHVASWGARHIGNPASTPPRSPSGYSYFHVGALRCDDGTDVAVGHLTMNTPHADLRSGHGAAQDHYADTGLAWADVRAGEDAHGIWVSGAVRPDVTDDQLRIARSSPLSGDWRWIGTGYEMVAALAVNTPGFPLVRTRSLVASGQPLALVAAGVMAQPTLRHPQRRDENLSRELLAELRQFRLERDAERHLRRILR